MSNLSDSFLLDVASGHAGATDAFVRRYGPPVWSLARRMLPLHEDAEDAVQEVFLDVWKSASRFDPSAGSELTFVMTIARRRLIDFARRRGRSPITGQLDLPELLPASEAPDPIQIGDELGQVELAMQELRPEQREVLELSLVQGQSHQQVAERTGMPLGTVKSHARRGLMRVRRLLGVEDPPNRSGGAP